MDAENVLTRAEKTDKVRKTIEVLVAKRKPCTDRSPCRRKKTLS